MGQQDRATVRLDRTLPVEPQAAPWVPWVLVGSTAIALSAWFVYLYRADFQTLAFLCREDGLLESLSAFFYLVASVAFLRAGIRSRNVWCWGYALLFFGIAGEEVSWGQRMFGISTPEFFETTNVQQEMNLHNIEGIHGSVRAAALLVILGICFLLPAIELLSRRARDVIQNVGMPVFPLWLTPLPALAVAFMAVPRWWGGGASFELDEVGEALLSVGFLLFALARAIEPPGQAPTR